MTDEEYKHAELSAVCDQISQLNYARGVLMKNNSQMQALQVVTKIFDKAERLKRLCVVLEEMENGD